ncbi:MAG: hypothetical protein WC718_14450 [Phycisphaerales bacterium]|jgi:hypothetical protein
MPDPVEGQAQGAESQGSTNSGTASGQAQGEEFDKDRAMATIKKLRDFEKEAKAQLKELETLKAKQAEQEQANMSEKEKAEARAAAAEKEREEARAEARRLRVERAIEKAAAKLGLDADLAASLLKPDALEIDEEGKPKGVEEALGELLKKWPQLKGEKPQVPNVNATDGKGGMPNQDPKEREAELRSRYRI